jgi:hypothetical protein
MLRFQKNAVINQDTLDKIAVSVIDNSAALQKIGEKNALLLYIKLYLIKLLTGKTAESLSLSD